MLNLDNVSTQARAAFDEGNAFTVLIVRCLKTGGRFVSVRSVSPNAFVTGLKACAKDRNFGAYNSPILESIRKYGEEGHSISLHSVHKNRKAANAEKKALVEKQAENRPTVNLNWNRPVKAMPVTEFRWYNEDEVAAMAKARRDRAKAKTIVQVQPEAQAQPEASI
jgi:hypothetical protein